ncbi:MAG: hypothetical protein A3B23_00060 [Candidatus Colwellbacteria bacterium RIFCSPLOWO2_01_FULL_48_10]|uniref:Uncharacterized protein n=1 Tax=Candidatus Colwellbacteria bacterium RIFCSPLOWO2_01_FULL_48_10 TaxID=1797690 RepID=A0A1G1Z6U6_9BACT|nr:MAG: hypothetical protein A3B23_00060 [Candidatus Colwellbacteria bacterium RIFCSPLOWO2_01_FULL_48_10]
MTSDVMPYTPEDITRQIGGLPVLRKVWDLGGWEHDGLYSALFLFFFYFGSVIIAMFTESIGRNSTIPWPGRRNHHWTFLTGSIAWPFYALMAFGRTYGVEGLNRHWFTETWFHALLLPMSFAVSFGVSNLGRRYTQKQLRSPSKLVHTITFAFVMYWLGSISIPALYVIFSEKDWIGLIYLAMPAVAFLVSVLFDMKMDHWNVHPEGFWKRWNWRVRPRFKVREIKSWPNTRAMPRRP